MPGFGRYIETCLFWVSVEPSINKVKNLQHSGFYYLESSLDVLTTVASNTAVYCTVFSVQLIKIDIL